MSFNVFAPIAVFAFNRAGHLQRTLDALAANELANSSSLTIFCDGPRSLYEKVTTDTVCQVAHAEVAKGRFASVRVKAFDANKGLAPSLIAGITAMLEESERVIVLEDDLITSPYFLRYMNDGLDVYVNNPHVASIHGYMYPHKKPCKADTFFLRGADCWGWATWKRAWAHFEVDAEVLLAEISDNGIASSVNADNSYDFTGMLKDVAAGRVSSWAVRWHASTFLKNMYTLYPRQSLVFHDGSDGSGTNCSVDDLYDVPLAQEPMLVIAVPVKQDEEMFIERKLQLRRESGGTTGMITGKIWRKFPVLKKIWRTCRNFVKAY